MTDNRIQEQNVQTKLEEQLIAVDIFPDEQFDVPVTHIGRYQPGQNKIYLDNTVHTSPGYIHKKMTREGKTYAEVAREIYAKKIDRTKISWTGTRLDIISSVVHVLGRID